MSDRWDRYEDEEEFIGEEEYIDFDEDYHLEDFNDPGDLYNDEEYESPYYRRRKIFYRLIGFLILIIFVTYVSASFIRIFTLPPLDFLHESGKLLEDPEIAGLQEAVVKIKVDGGGVPGVGRGSSRGSGFNIDEEGFIVTNRHVVENGDIVTVLFEEDGVHRVSEIIKPSNSLDVAFLKLEGGEDLPVTTMKEDPDLSVDDEVIVIGNPLGFSRIANKGVVADLVEISNHGPLLEIAAPIYPGSSGSPVFDSEGEVIGIIYAAREVAEDDIRGIALNIVEVQKLLKEEET